MSAISFDLLKRDAGTAGRVGVMHTPHGDVPTPVFAPVGTQATVKALSPRELEEMGATLLLSNTYHLYLRPGAEIVAEMGGLHRFMGWEHPILTDSGGFQVFSLQDLRRVSDEGVVFRSHLDGSQHEFTPEKVMQVEELLGADIAMVLDECAPPLDRDYSIAAMRRTHLWAERCLAAHTRPDQALFAIVQGGIFRDLRQESARFLTSLDFPGYAIGGLSVGEPKEDMHAMLEAVEPILPAGKPRYLMGVGSPEDLFEGVARGVDIFDCAMPTRLARNGTVLVPTGRLNMKNAEFAHDPRPIQEGCGCEACRHFSRAYIRHLIKAEEILGVRLTSLHNSYFMVNLMGDIRRALLEDRFSALKEEFLAGFQVIPHEVRTQNKQAFLERRRKKNEESCRDDTGA